MYTVDISDWANLYIIILDLMKSWVPLAYQSGFGWTLILNIYSFVFPTIPVIAFIMILHKVYRGISNVRS